MKKIISSLLSLYAGLAFADMVGSQLERAADKVRIKEYSAAISATQPLLDNLSLTTVEQIVQAHKILGVAYCEIGEQTKAQEHFQTLVSFSPTESLGDLVHTKPCTQMYEQVRAPGKTIAAPPPGTPQQAVVKEAKPNSSSGSNWKLVVPFGVGQFENHQPEKGLAFMSTEIAAFATSIVGYALFQGEKESDGTFPDPGTAEVYRGMYWAGLGVGCAVVVWGVIDAIVVHKRVQSASSRFSTRYGQLSYNF